MENSSSFEPFIIVITGAAGYVASSLLYKLLEQSPFSSQRKLIYRLVDLPENDDRLHGLLMEIADCNYSENCEIEVCPEIPATFNEADLLIFIGGHPRKEGQSRSDLLAANSKLFKHQGQLCNQGFPKPNCRVLVVANPCNTNALVFSHFAKNIQQKNVTSLSMLDQFRAKQIIAEKVNCKSYEIKNAVVYGNHSDSLFVDVSNAFISKKNDPKINKEFLSKSINEDWVFHELQTKTQKRGNEILKMKGSSSGQSASNAIFHHIRIWYNGSAGEMCSFGVISDIFGISICVSIPVIVQNQNDFVLLENEFKKLDPESQSLILKSVQELFSEKQLAWDLLEIKD